ncbi:NADH-quinone oxidoreductase subunit M [Opitutus sp. ER46]|uniref:complex I subunit 4 family protein n=1 Tax=Opitutus sp. ER46 TaxID=2161864 RepID=UPI000D301E07|nr:NADH-quinone oxidoreductase subunit M [Opitutus sp. ER46]PTX95794.1 NADH-quinone oxidoreductase subunit N [Opitutus sp. ER46]
MSDLPFDPLLLSIAAPLAVALLIALGLPKRWSVWLAGFGFAVPLLMSLHTWWHFDGVAHRDGYAFLTQYATGLGGLGISLKLGLNGISMPLFAMAGIVGFAAGLYALQSEAERLKMYLMLLLVMLGGLMGVFASVDVFFLYFFHELALIPTFIMVGVWGGRDRSYAAMTMTIYLTVGAMISLLGLIILYVKSGAHTFDLIALRAHLAAHPLGETLQQNIFGLLMFGLGILVSLWPLHTWAPLGYGAAPSSNAMLHAGVLKKFGLYGLIQVALPLVPAGLGHWAVTLGWLAAIGNVLVVGFITIAQRDLKQMIGYSSVMHMGYAFLGIAAGSTLGVGGVVMMMVAHGLSVALLFLLATSIHHRTQTFAMDEMGGLVTQAPVLAAFFAAASFASIGLPGFANFWGELAIFVALWAFSPTLTVIAVAGVIISAIYGLRAVARVFFGEATDKMKEVAAKTPPTDLRWAEKIPALVLLAFLFLIGFWPRSISDPIHAAVTPAANAPVAAVATHPVLPR